MSTSIFEIYYDIAFTNGLERITSQYLGNKDLKNEGYSYYQDLGYYVNHILEDVDSVSATFSTSTIRMVDFISLTLENDKREILSKLKRARLESNSKDFKLYLENNFAELDKSLIKIKKTPDFTFKDTVTSNIEMLVSDLKILFGDVTGHNKLYNHTIAINYSNTYFSCKDLKMSFFKDLYISTYELNLIDDSIIDEETFINVFTTPKPIPESPIIFMAGNALVAYYLESLEIFFNNFNPKTIEESKMFLNKQKTPITSSILYTSKSRASEKVKSQYPNIDYHIELLKDEFLK